jgi:hypothetical protein
MNSKFIVAALDSQIRISTAVAQSEILFVSADPYVVGKITLLAPISSLLLSAVRDAVMISVLGRFVDSRAQEWQATGGML